MKTKTSQAPGDRSEEIAALIEALHQTGQRLEQLTGGEVDTVANRAGQTFLLRHAQDQLRQNESARQVAILNALPASIALLDSQGIILSVNEAWQQFSRANAAHNPGHDVGVNYLTVCDQARGDDAAEASQAAAGIRAVLDGMANTFTLEYPCHSPAEQRWFLMTVTPLAGYTSKGAVVMHLNITERKQAEKMLRTSEQRLELALDAGQIGVWDLDLVHDTSWRSLQHDRIFGYESLLPEWGQAIFLRHVASEDRDRVSQCFEEAIRTGQLDFECQITRTDQDRRWIHARGKVNRDLMDRPVSILGTVIDITERKLAEEQIHLQAERLTTTLESITDALFTVDLKWRFTFLNREAERLLKRTRAELTGLELWTEFPDTIGSTFEREYRRAMADNKAVSFEEFYPPLNTWFDVRAYPSEQGLAVYFRDITEAKRNAEEIRFKNTMLLTQQETSLDAILIVDEHGQILSYNQQFIALWRLSPQLVSAHLEAPMLQSAADQAENSASFVAGVQYLYEHRDDKSHEEIPLKDGRIIDRYSAPAIGADGKYYGRVWYFGTSPSAYIRILRSGKANCVITHCLKICWKVMHIAERFLSRIS